MTLSVPDLSPEGLSRLTAEYRDDVDHAAVRILQTYPPDHPDTLDALIQWRTSAGLSKAGTARLLGMAKYSYLRIENGDKPITQHFLTVLNGLLVQLDTTGFPFHPHDRKSSAPKFRMAKNDYIPRAKIAGDLEQRRCANPDCTREPWFFSLSKQRKYCSDYCADYVAHQAHEKGVLTRRKVQHAERKPVTACCPHCGRTFAVKGHITSGPPGFRRGEAARRGQADHDPALQALKPQSDLLPDQVLSRGPDGLQPDGQVPIVQPD